MYKAGSRLPWCYYCDVYCDIRYYGSTRVTFTSNNSTIVFHNSSTMTTWNQTYTYLPFIICQMFIVQAHWSIPSHMTICNQAYFLSKTILTRQYYSILFNIMVLLLWHHIVLLWYHSVLLFDRIITPVLLWYLTSQYDITIVAPCPRL